MRVDEAGWLEAPGNAVVRVPSVRSSVLDSTLAGPLGLVWHWTGGYGGPTFALNLANSIRTYNRASDRPASWHVLIAKNGTLFQSLPFNVGAWHVGRPGRLNGKLFGNINRATVGVELENAGTLEKVEGKFYCWPFWLNPDAPPEQRKPDPKLEVPGAVAMPHDGKFYESFTSAQMRAAEELVRSLVIRFKWPQTAVTHGHRDFDPARKIDPGPVWQEVVLPAVLARVFGPPNV